MAEMEDILRPPERQMPDYPAKVIDLKTGEKMIVRQARREEAATIMEAIAPLVRVEKDYFDIVAARTYAELLAWKRYRVRDEYCLVGLIDGLLVGQVNGRMWDEDIGVSYHTLTLKRGRRVGAHLFASKMEYHIEFLKQKEVQVTAESPIGFRRWMEEYGLVQRPGQHELGGADIWALTEEVYRAARERLVQGARPVPEELMETARTIRIPSPEQLLSEMAGQA
ncbi:hypothetical protein ACFL0G_06440 [Candidatus Zixiibacteriota bacterium]